ncbi:RRN3-domain-containing protein, partial [Rozella allomycis CSF55]
EDELEKVQEAVLKGGDEQDEVDEGDEDEDEKQIEKRNEIVEKDIDSDSDEEVDDEDDEDEMEEQISDIKASIETLDSLMKLTFENVKEIMEKEEDKEMFLVFMSIFEKTILRTFNSRYVQFIFFYVTSLDSKYHDIFLGMLMSKLFHNKSVILCDPIRISCAGYIGSFIARGLFLSDKLINKCFSMLISWAVQYVDNVQDVNKIEDHSLFYCIVQALLYIFCFRYELLMNETNKELLEKVLFSSLEPLLVCVESVTEEFIDVCSHLNFIFCRHLVEKKERNHLSILDSFFPFDPYKLKESSLFLDSLNIYKEYTSINDEVEQEENTIYDSPSQESTSSITDHLNSLWQQNITVN